MRRDIDPFFAEPEEDEKLSDPFSQDSTAVRLMSREQRMMRFMSDLFYAFHHLTRHSGSLTVPFSQRSRIPRLKSGHSK